MKSVPEPPLQVSGSLSRLRSGRRRRAGPAPSFAAPRRRAPPRRPMPPQPAPACPSGAPAFRLLHPVPPSRFVPFRSVLPPPGCPGRRDPLSRAFACGRGRVFAPARFARLIARARGQAPGAPLPPPVRPGFAQAARRFRRPPPAGVAKCHVLSCGVLRGVVFCHAISCSPYLRRCFAVPFLHIVPSSSVPSALPPAWWAGPFTARICVRARARVSAGAVRAPDCPRTSQAQGAPLPSVPPGLFSPPQPPSCAEKRKRRPREPPFLRPL